MIHMRMYTNLAIHSGKKQQNQIWITPTKPNKSKFLIHKLQKYYAAHKFFLSCRRNTTCYYIMDFGKRGPVTTLVRSQPLTKYGTQLLSTNFRPKYSLSTVIYMSLMFVFPKTIYMPYIFVFHISSLLLHS